MYRKFPREIKRVVIKVGSSVIATYKMKPKITHLRSLVAQICAAQKNGMEVILVSSGAIVLGMGELKQKTRSLDLAQLQATAAVGQTVLMNTYNALFKKHKGCCAQVLLTWDDFNDRSRFNNASNAFAAMLDMGIVPVVNENDTISTEEIKFGDNDRLSAMLASMMKADLLVILSDVEGLYDLKNGEKKVFEEIKEITQDIQEIAGGTAKKQISKGGMTAKLEAIKIATKANTPCIIAHGETENVLERILKGERIGTLFIEREEKFLARKHWISFGAKPKGILIVDDGAKVALLKGGKSLLLPGIVSWSGHFQKHDIVIVQDNEKQEIARGITNYSTADLENVQDKKGKPEVIHVDNMVFSERF
ncbi:MAG TPA: glutamate 5-kinase [Candidatus Omnitrophota bacterium]|nr:glutamate 5-kinase [Candidatus Omnitrophota bacterium]